MGSTFKGLHTFFREHFFSLNPSNYSFTYLFSPQTSKHQLTLFIPYFNSYHFYLLTLYLLSRRIGNQLLNYSVNLHRFASFSRDWTSNHVLQPTMHYLPYVKFTFIAWLLTISKKSRDLLANPVDSLRQSLLECLYNELQITLITEKV